MEACNEGETKRWIYETLLMVRRDLAYGWYKCGFFLRGGNEGNISLSRELRPTRNIHIFSMEIQWATKFKHTFPPFSVNIHISFGQYHLFIWVRSYWISTSNMRMSPLKNVYSSSLLFETCNGNSLALCSCGWFFKCSLSKHYANFLKCRAYISFRSIYIFKINICYRIRIKSNAS